MENQRLQKRRPFPSDLTTTEWQGIAPLVPPSRPGGRPRDQDMREVMNAILYLLGNGCSWRQLPAEFPPWQTVYTYLRQWKQDGTLTHLRQIMARRPKRIWFVPELTVHGTLAQLTRQVSEEAGDRDLVEDVYGVDARSQPEQPAGPLDVRVLGAPVRE
jgi:transposase